MYKIIGWLGGIALAIGLGEAIWPEGSPVEFYKSAFAFGIISFGTLLGAIADSMEKRNG